MVTSSFIRPFYRGPLRAVIFDWAGTTVDYGSLAPVLAIRRVLSRHGISVSAEVIRASMGKHKREHLRDVLFSSEVRPQWTQRYGSALDETVIESLYQEFLPIQEEVLIERAKLIPSTLQILSELRQRGLKIGTTSGYTREMMAVLLPQAQAMGFQPDSVVCASDVPQGRPAPWMALISAMEMGVYPLQAIVKIGDTPLDMAEARNAGMWAVGVALTGNEIGLDEEEIQTLPSDELTSRLENAYERLYQAGAHYVVDGIWDIPPILDKIEEHLQKGERP